MHLISKINFLNKNFFSLVLALIPFSFVAGNMVININVILIITATILIYNKSFFNMKFYKVDKIILAFFLLIIFTGIINEILVLNDLSWRPKFATTIKSIFFLKYFLLYLSLRFLVENKIIKLKFFYITCSIASIFVCLDIFFQYFTGKDIFGYDLVPEMRKLSGPFGNEYIAGGFIQRFSIFSFFLIPLYFAKNVQNYIKYLIPILFIIFFLGIILSGNRMPMLLFLFNLALILIFQKQVKKYFLPFIFSILIVFISVFNLNEKVKLNFESFYGQISKILVIALNKDLNKNESPQYFKEFSSFYETWKVNKYIGGGIKNFRYYCHVRDNIDKNSKFICNMHPHNYYLEILTETGLLGCGIVLCFFIITLYLSFFKKYFSFSNLKNNNSIVPFMFLFIIEIFPIKSTGSFFTTGNATYIFLILAILIGLIRKENLIENKI